MQPNMSRVKFPRFGMQIKVEWQSVYPCTVIFTVMSRPTAQFSFSAADGEFIAIKQLLQRADRSVFMNES